MDSCLQFSNHDKLYPSNFVVSSLSQSPLLLMYQDCMPADVHNIAICLEFKRVEFWI